MSYINVVDKSTGETVKFGVIDLIVRNTVYNEGITEYPEYASEATEIVKKILEHAMDKYIDDAVPDMSVRFVLPDEAIERSIVYFVESFTYDATCDACDHQCVAMLHRDAIAQATREVIQKYAFHLLPDWEVEGKDADDDASEANASDADDFDSFMRMLMEAMNADMDADDLG